MRDRTRDDADRSTYRRSRARPLNLAPESWATKGRTNPERAPDESDPDGIEALIRDEARRYAGDSPDPVDRRGRPLPRGRRGQFAPGPTDAARAERDVTVYLTSVAFEMTRAALAEALGISCRGEASRRIRAGERIVREARRGITEAV